MLKPVGDQPAVAASLSKKLAEPEAVIPTVMSLGASRAPMPVGLLPAVGMQGLAKAVANLGIGKVMESAAAAARPASSSASTAVGAALPKGAMVEGWPNIPCHTCNKSTCWRNCQQVRHWLESTDGSSAADSDEMYETWYFCLSCVALERGISEPEARGWIRANRQDLQHKMARTAEWKRARDAPPTTFEFASSSRAEKRVLLRQQVLDVWRPAAKAILLKAQQMMVRVARGEEHIRLCELLKQEKDLDRIEALLEQVDAAEDLWKQSCEPLGYADGAKSKEELFRWQMAADYDDSWSEVRSSSGKLLGGSSAFYICKAGGADACNTLMLS